MLPRLADQVGLMVTELDIFKFIHESARDERVEVLDVAPAFFQTTQNALLAHIIITLDKLFDDGESAKRSLVYFLGKVKENLPTMSLKNNFISAEILDSQIAQISAVQPILKKIGIHRDCYRAHSDKKCFDNPHKLSEDAPISLEELQEVVGLAESILKMHYLGLLGIDSMIAPHNGLDVENIVTKIQEHRRATRTSEGRAFLKSTE